MSVYCVFVRVHYAWSELSMLLGLCVVQFDDIQSFLNLIYNSKCNIRARFWSHIIAFQIGHSVPCHVGSLLPLTLLTRFAALRFVMLALLALFTGSLTHFAHSFIGQ